MRQAFPLAMAIALTVAMGCAQQRAPTGGQIDKTAPEVVYTQPKNYSTHFSASEIKIRFNEYVEPNKINQQLVVSPPLEEKPVVTVRGKEVRLELQGSLMKNTTYTFNFGKGVKDYTEGNTVSDLLYVVSTGSYLDSLEVSGRVSRALTGQAEKNMLVMLYRQKADSMPRKSLPRYFDRTSASGAFHIQNIAPGHYRIFALHDQNVNYLYDLIGERLAFSDTLVTAQVIDSTYRPVSLRSFTRRDTNQFITQTKKWSYGSFAVGFNIPTRPNYKINIAEGNGNAQAWKWTNETSDSLRVWLTGIQKAEQINIPLFADTLPLDTIRWYLPKPGKRDSASFNISSNLNGGQLDQQENLEFNLPHPIDALDTSRIGLTADSLQVQYSLHRPTNALRHFEISYDYRPGKNYHIRLLPGTVTDIFGHSNDTLKNNFTVFEDNFYGALQVTLSYRGPQAENLVLELLSENGVVLQKRLTRAGSVEEFSKLHPATYNLRLILDRNGNGEWDPGNYNKHLQPEKSINYSTPLKIRSNWVQETDWVIGSPSP